MSASPEPPAARISVIMVIQRLRPYFSGQGVQVEDLSTELARRGVDVTILTSVRGPQPPVEEIGGYRVKRLRCDVPGLGFTARTTRVWVPIFGLRAFIELWRLRKRVDVVHVHSLTDALYTARLFSWLWTVPLVLEMTLVGTDDPLSVRRSPQRFRGLRWALYRQCDGYVAISPALAERYRRAGLPEPQLQMIPQGVDTDRFKPADDRAEVRERLGLPADDPLVVFVGSLIRRKGIDVLLQAWNRVHFQYPDAWLVLVGKNEFDDDPAATAFLDRCLGDLAPAAAARTLQVGVRDDAHRYLQAADAFVFPSRREGFGTVMIEAMACGVPCVVSELPGITDFIFDRPGEQALMVPREDGAALADAVAKLLGDDVAAREVGRQGRLRALAAFSFKRIADEYLDLYDRLLARRRPTE